jgi:dTDP-4-amino-4,6-dideoxygalactose transaminase
MADRLVSAASDTRYATPIEPTVPPWPFYDEDEIEAVSAVLRSGRVNQWTGPKIRAFEDASARTIGRSHAIAVANGSVAIEIALRALNIGHGDEVIVPARSFVATASSVALAGASPVFADVDYDTQLITPKTIAPLIGPKTRGVIPVHLNGRPCDMEGIMSLAQRHQIQVIEDCAQSFGARIGEKMLGAFGDAAAFSFCQDKIISTGGEGGLIAFTDHSAFSRAWSFKDHGKSREKVFAEEHPPGYRWVHSDIGTNARMTEMQAAIGLVQLGKLKRWIERRNAIANRLASALSAYSCVQLPSVPDGHVHARYRLEFTVADDLLRHGWNRDKIMAALNREGVPANTGTCPEIYREGAFASESGLNKRLPNAAKLATSSLVLLTHPTMDESYVASCERAIRKVFGAASS